MPKVIGVALQFPENEYSQNEILEGLLRSTRMTDLESQLVKNFFNQVQIKTRRFARPMKDYETPRSFDQKNLWWQESALALASKAVTELMDRFDIPPQRIDLIATSTVTGLSVPTLDAKLMNAFDFSPATKRLPIFGLGCVAGVAGINRVCDYLKGYPNSCALFIGVELCSLTFQMQDSSKANLVATSLFGDGCGAVLIVGDQHPLADKQGLKFIGSESHFFKNSEQVMGWDIGQNGFKVVLSNEVPQFVSKGLTPLTQSAMFKYGFELDQIKYNFTHPGGPKVITAVKESWPFPDSYYDRTWANLEKYGNMSSVSVLTNFYDFLSAPRLQPGKGLSLAFGPAFCAELGVWETA